MISRDKENTCHCGLRPCVFLDRDGVLNEERSYITELCQLAIFPYVKKCIQAIHRKGYLAIVISNQSGIARGILKVSELEKMNDYLREQTEVDGIYCCPHLPSGRDVGYAIECECRKPKTGLIGRACREHGIDLSRSIMVGDRASDILTGKKAGIKTVLLESGYGTRRLEADVEPDYIMGDLRDILNIL